MARYPRNEQTFHPEKSKSFRCPSDLSPTASNFWKAIAPPLLKAGVLSDIDRPAFRTLCRCYGLLEMASGEMEKSGCTTENLKTGELKKHPSSTIYKSQADLFAKLALMFGLVPAARGKISCAPADEEDDLNLVLNKGIK